ncbi:MAG: AMP-binding protein [Phormidesmis sp.]
METAAQAKVTLAATPKELWEGLRPDWLVVKELGNQTEHWQRRVCHYRQQLERSHQQHCRSDYDSKNLANSRRPLLLLAEAEAADFLAGFMAALLADWDVALANPRWGQQEWQSVGQPIRPDWVLGKNPFPVDGPVLSENINRQRTAQSAILIPTGGSSGQIKFACHTWDSLMASVSGFLQFFCPQAQPVNSYCTLPLYHVSGLMQILRTWRSGGQTTLLSWKTLSPFPPFPLPHTYLSLVPTQLQHLLHTGQTPWLRHFRAVLLGGAPAWPDLLNHAADQRIPLSLSYGMTETAAMVTALSPEAFLRGDRSSGRALPHVTVRIEQNGQILPAKTNGQIVIHSPATALGYHHLSSPSFLSNTFYTDDLGYLSAEGDLYITGRISGKIISGGENVFPAEVETAIRSTKLVKDVCVIGMPDRQWGEAVVAAYVPVNASVSVEGLKAAIALKLSRYKQPKHWVCLEALPRNAQGKINRQGLLAHLSPVSSLEAQPLANGDGDRPR